MKKVLFLLFIAFALASCATAATEEPDHPNDCIRWDVINNAQLGQAVCIYGNIAKMETIEDGSTNIYFSTQPNTFFMQSKSSVNQQIGDCIWSTHVLLAFGNIRYMVIEKLGKC